MSMKDYYKKKKAAFDKYKGKFDTYMDKREEKLKVREEKLIENLKAQTEKHETKAKRAKTITSYKKRIQKAKATRQPQGGGLLGGMDMGDMLGGVGGRPPKKKNKQNDIMSGFNF